MAHIVYDAIQAGNHAAATTEMRRMEDEARRIRRYFEPVWALIRGFYLGNQTLRIRGGRLVPDRRTLTTDVFYSNQILPRVRATVAALTGHKPTFQAVVADEDDAQARTAGTLAQEVLEALRYRTKLDGQTRRATLFAVLAGQGYLLAGYDKHLGPVIDGRRCLSCGSYFVDSEDCPTCPAPMTPEDAAAALAEWADPLDVAARASIVKAEVEVIRIEEGDLFVKAIPPWNILWDPSAETERDAAWCSIEHFASKETVRSRFGIEATEESIDMGLELFPGPTALIAEPKRMGVIIRETIWKPTREYPRGLRVLWHGDKVLSWSPECSPDGELPVAVIAADEAPGRFYRKALAEDLVPLQIKFTEQMNRLFKLADLAADPRIIAEEGSIADGEPYVRDEDQSNFLWYKKSARRMPDFERPPLVSPVFAELLDRLSNQMDFIAQQYAPARGEPGRSVTSGLQARLLIERTTQSLGQVSASIEEAVARVGKILLLEAQRRFDEEKVMAYAGDYGKPKVARFRGADLAGVSEVHVVAGSAFPESREARRDFLLELAQRVVTEPEQRRALVEAMGVAVRMPPDPMETVRAQVADENDRLLAASTIPVERADFHESHIKEHRIFQASEAYRRAPPDVRRAFEKHVEAHERMLAGEQAIELARQRTIAAVADSAAPAGGQPAIEPTGGIQ